VIPPRQNRTASRQIDEALYQTRHLIENFSCKLKQFRGIATRYDKTARNLLAALHLAAATIWLNRRQALDHQQVMAPSGGDLVMLTIRLPGRGIEHLTLIGISHFFG
jgi:hypothetical protein